MKNKVEEFAKNMSQLAGEASNVDKEVLFEHCIASMAWFGSHVMECNDADELKSLMTDLAFVVDIQRDKLVEKLMEGMSEEDKNNIADAIIKAVTTVDQSDLH